MIRILFSCGVCVFTLFQIFLHECASSASSNDSHSWAFVACLSSSSSTTDYTSSTASLAATTTSPIFTMIANHDDHSNVYNHKINHNIHGNDDRQSKMTPSVTKTKPSELLLLDPAVRSSSQVSILDTTIPRNHPEFQPVAANIHPLASRLQHLQQQQQQRSSLTPSSHEPCRVLIENRVDGYYEILESIMVRYPLPWNELGCSWNDQPIQFDVALSRGRSSRAWEVYYAQHLQGTQRQRVDGTTVLMGPVVTFSNSGSDRYHASIRAACDARPTKRYTRWLEADMSRHFCVMHKDYRGLPDSVVRQSCWLNPMVPTCHFVPIDLPPRLERLPPAPQLILCVPTEDYADHAVLASTLSRLRPKDVVVRIFDPNADLYPYSRYNVMKYVDLFTIHMSRFEDIHQQLSQCHIMVPLIDPLVHAEFSLDGNRWLVPFVSDAIAYNIPILAHTEFVTAYQKEWTAPAVPYANKFAFGGALEDLIRKIRDPDTAYEAFPSIEKERHPPCSILIDNFLSTGYQIVESTALRFPLLWKNMKCDNQVVYIDILNNDYVIDNKAEREGWNSYFWSFLHGSIRTRTDNVQIVFRGLVSEDTVRRSYDAVIRTNCDDEDYFSWLNTNVNGYCVLRKECEHCSKYIVSRSCWLDPMHPKCFFIPSDQPQFNNRSPVQKVINLCTLGDNSNHEMLATAFTTLRPTNIHLVIHENPLEDVSAWYRAKNVHHMVEFVKDSDFLTFRESISQCHLFLPLLDPQTHAGLFPSSDLKQNSGRLALAVSYKLPMILHQELAAVYTPHLTAPLFTYTDASSFANAFHDALQRIGNDPSFVPQLNAPALTPMKFDPIKYEPTPSTHHASTTVSFHNESGHKCRILVEKRQDYNYQLIESTVTMYPLPWRDLGCNPHDVVIFDVLFSHEAGQYDRKDRHSWELYYENYLQNSIRVRKDGQHVQFGKVLSAARHLQMYTATIDIGCGLAGYSARGGNQKNTFCVLHGVPQLYRYRSEHLHQPCWLNPMHPKCFFLPTEVPQFDNRPSISVSLNICALGDRANHRILAQAITALPLNNVNIYIYIRNGSEPKAYKRHNLNKKVHFAMHDDFLSFRESISRCHILLPLLDPFHHPEFFEKGLKRTAGRMTLAMGYRIPTILHRDLSNIYSEYLTAPYRTYTDGPTFNVALQDMITTIQRNHSYVPELEPPPTPWAPFLDRPKEMGEVEFPDNALISMEPCYLVLENKVDFHYEMLESAMMQYPLPWNELKCDITQPVQFDVALSKSVGHDFAGEGEGWVKYFLSSLQYSERERADGVVIRFGDFVDYSSYARQYHAVVDASCDFYQNKPWEEREDNTFCVMHGPKRYRYPESQLRKSCWLSPMHPYCYFIPSTLPQFDPRPPPYPTLHACVSGKNRHHAILAEALARLRPEGVRIRMYERRRDGEYAGQEEYLRWGVSEWIEVVQVPGFLEYQQSMSTCHLILPLLDPIANPDYFPQHERKMLTGALSQAIGYRIPSVMHEAMEIIYHQHLNAPVRTYTNAESFTLALDAMLTLVKQTTTE
jgi:hypothetical protein